MKIIVSGCGFTSALSRSGKTYWGLQLEDDSLATKHTRVLLLPPALFKLTQRAFLLLKRDAAPATGAAKAYHESQSRIFKTDAPLFVGAGEGTDNLDFLADLSVLKVIDPDEVNQAIPPGDQPAPKSNSRLLEKLKHEGLPCAHCAWCDETPKTKSMLEEHTMRFTMSYCSRLAVPHHQCFRPLWARNCDCDKGISVPIPRIECSSEKR